MVRLGGFLLVIKRLGSMHISYMSLLLFGYRFAIAVCLPPATKKRVSAGHRASICNSTRAHHTAKSCATLLGVRLETTQHRSSACRVGELARPRHLPRPTREPVGPREGVRFQHEPRPVHGSARAASRHPRPRWPARLRSRSSWLWSARLEAARSASLADRSSLQRMRGSVRGTCSLAPGGASESEEFMHCREACLTVDRLR